MKKLSKIAVISFILVIAVFFTACGKTTTSTDGEALSKVEQIKKAGKIVLGTSADYPPYEFHKEIDGKDTIVGFDIEIAKAIAKDLGVELEIKDMDFDGLLLALNANKVDFVIAGMTPDPERDVDFSQIYYKALQGIVVNTENKDVFKTIDDLTGKKIGAQKGAVQEELAKSEIKDLQLKSLSKIPDLVLEIKHNKIDALVMEKPVAEAYVDKNDDLHLMDLTLDDGEGGSSVAVKRGEQELMDLIDETLDKLIKDGSIDKFVIEAIEMVE